MIYNEELYDISNNFNKNNTNNESVNNVSSIIRKKQEKVLNMLIKKFKQKLYSDDPEIINSKSLTIRIESDYWSNNNDFKDIKELIEDNNFEEFASEYCIYLTDTYKDYSPNCKDYYEITWDYKLYNEIIKSEIPKEKKHKK